jgi:uncharacterized membrane protein
VSDVIAIAYPDEATAREVRDKLLDLQRGHAIELEDVVVVTRDGEGKVKLHQATNLTATGAAGGALWGSLIGLLFLAPLFGALIGGAAGAAGGALTDIGIQDDFLRELGEKLSAGTAAVIVLIRKVTPDKVLPEISPYGGEVLQTSLNDEGERRLQEALTSGAGPAAPTTA